MRGITKSMNFSKNYYLEHILGILTAKRIATEMPVLNCTKKLLP